METAIFFAHQHKESKNEKKLVALIIILAGVFIYVHTNTKSLPKSRSKEIKQELTSAKAEIKNILPTNSKETNPQIGDKKQDWFR